MQKHSFEALEATRLAPFVRRVKTILSVIVLLLVGVLFLPWQQTVEGEAELIALDPAERPYHILAPFSGVVAEYYVSENRFVEKGEPLFRLVDLDADYLQRLEEGEAALKKELDAARKGVAVAREALEAARRERLSGLAQRRNAITMARNRFEARKSEREALRLAYETARLEAQRSESLHREGIASKKRLERA
ncbi:HlyD family efflux transporter periplasmic adaptor subunit [Hydrogenimonas sp.]